jgi:hypothetical protein
MFFLLMSVSAEVWAADCDCKISATARPDATAVDLLRRLAKANDYGGGRCGGWLAQRLFPLANKVTLTGKVMNCPARREDDGDFEFQIELSDPSRIKKYFDRGSKNFPTNVNVEAIPVAVIPVPAVPPVKRSDTTGPFPYWGPQCIPWCVQYGALGAKTTKDMTNFDDVSKLLKTGKCVEVTGSFVIDMNGLPLGSGQLEIHPVTSIRVVPDSECLSQAAVRARQHRVHS